MPSSADAVLGSVPSFHLDFNLKVKGVADRFALLGNRPLHTTNTRYPLCASEPRIWYVLPVVSTN